MSAVQPPSEAGSKGAERYFVSSEATKASGYLLPADEKERLRLNLQGEAINAVFDNKLIWAPITLKDGDTVLDSGTGSGHWLLSLAAQVPRTINLRGTDISPRMFPSPSLTPPNATFAPLSITSLPEDWSNSLTLIHQRLLIVALEAHQWHTALSEMHRTLVPGGWVQLFEPNHLFVSPDEAIVNHKAVKIRNILSLDVRHVVIDIVDHLPGWLEKAGFVNLTIQKRDLPMGSWAGEIGKKGLHSTMDVWRAIKEPVMKENVLGLLGIGEEYDDVVDDFERRLEETPESYLQYWVFTAQKPVDA